MDSGQGLGFRAKGLGLRVLNPPILKRPDPESPTGEDRTTSGARAGLQTIGTLTVLNTRNKSGNQKKRDIKNRKSTSLL